MPFRTLLRHCGWALLALGSAACGGEETAPEPTHAPARAALFIDGTEVPGNALVLEPGQMVRVEVRFFDADDVELTGLEDGHHAALAFTPPGLVTVADVADRPFHKDLTAQGSAGTGQYTIGYGHTLEADELSWGPYEVSVVEEAAATRR